MINNFTGIILSGGKSTRMGEDKAFKLFSGIALIEIVIEKMSSLFSELLIVTNTPEFYEKYGIPTTGDIVKGYGPLGGIYAGLTSSERRYNFVAACDMPFLNKDLIKFITKEAESYDAVVPRFNGRLEPLCAAYTKACIKAIEKNLSDGSLKMTDFLKNVKARIVDENDVARFDKKGLSFVNINTPHDSLKFKGRMREHAPSSDFF